MRCPDCKGSVSISNIVRDKVCPACGANLRRMPTKEQIRESLITFAEDKGYIFWSMVYVVIVWVFGIFGQIFCSGTLYDYISDHGFRFLFLAVMAGSIIDYYAKANVEVTSVRNKFIFRPPIFLRRFRFWTNVFLVLAIGLSIFIEMTWPGYINILPVITFISTFMLCLIWAIMGIFVTEDDVKDKRIAYFLGEMRVKKVRYYNRASGFFIGGMFIAGFTFYKLIHVSGLWWYISNSRFVYNTVTFWKMYFSWIHKFID